MVRLERILFGILACLTLLCGTASASAESATDFIRGRQNEVMTVLQSNKPGAARDKKVGDVLAKMLDYDYLARASLASHWNDVNDTQRKEFAETLQKLVQRSYERNIKDVLNFNVEYVREEPQDSQFMVYTRATPKTNKGEEPVTINYRLDQHGGKWRVIDIITEDSSLVANYKSQFHRTIQKDGFDGLIRKMKNKLAKGDTAKDDKAD